MALAAATIADIRTTGDDTNNGGLFDPSQTAGMFTDGAATVATTSAPVFTSASYNFVAGDVGAWLFIASGTNWLAGWYQIASVAANAATLTATAGTGRLVASNLPYTVSTATGCASTGSPTGATWTIDYSQQNTAQFAYTDLASVGAGLLVSSVAKPFGKQQVGNGLVITGGTNFTTGRYVIASVSVGLVATVVGPNNITTGAGVSGTGGQGGALASLGQFGAVRVSGNTAFFQAGTYTLTGATANVAGGPFTITTNNNIHGWNTIRTSDNTDSSRPTISVPNTATYNSVKVIQSIGTGIQLRRVDVTFQGSTPTSTVGIECIGSGQNVRFCKVTGATGHGIRVDGIGSQVWFCEATGCSGTAAIKLGDNGNVNVCSGYYCEAWGNTCDGFLLSGGYATGCWSYLNTGGSSRGFWATSGGITVDCVAYANGSHGFGDNSTSQGLRAVNCLAEANAGYGFFGGANNVRASLMYCGTYNNTLGATDGVSRFAAVIGFVTNTTGTFFVDAANGNLALNATAAQGALARATGYPGTSPRGTSVGYRDIGAVQHADPAAAGLIVNPGMDGGWE